MENSASKDQSTEQKILEAARQVFMEQGMAGARMQDIADRAGINKALLHYYFRSKEKLFEVVFVQAAASFLPRLNVLFTSELPVFDKIREFVSVFIGLVMENPYVPIFLINEMNKRNSAAFIVALWKGEKPSVGVMIQQIQEAEKQGLIKPVNPVQLIMNLMSLCLYPFVAKPMAQIIWDINDEQFRTLMEERRTFVADFIIDSIKK